MTGGKVSAPMPGSVPSRAKPSGCWKKAIDIHRLGVALTRWSVDTQRPPVHRAIRSPIMTTEGVRDKDDLAP